MREKPTSAKHGPSTREPTAPPLKVLIVEDVPTDAELALRELTKAGISHDAVRVDTRHGYLNHLEEFAPDIIISDYSMPGFNGLEALALARDKAPETPFIFVSGTIGEEVAIESLKRGAIDYILKSNLKRLGPAVERALQDVTERRARLSIERQLNEARIRFELFMRYLPGAAFIKDGRGRYQFVNWAWEEIRGRKLADVIGRTDGNLWPELAGQFESSDQLEFDSNESARSIETFPRPDGLHQYMVHKFPIRDRDGRFTLVGGIAIDFTERLRAEEKIARLSRMQAVLSGINSTIVRVRDRTELFRESCRIAVEAGGFTLAWIGMLDTQTQEVKPAVWVGKEDGYLASIRLSARADVPAGQGIVGRAIRAKKPVIVNDIASDPHMTRVQESLARGFRAIVALPLLSNGEAIGVLVLNAGESGVFDQEEMLLLTELSGDISFALDYIYKAEALNYLAYYDGLTGLPNRTLFCNRVNNLVQSHALHRDGCAVVMLNVERFRFINDSFGRQAGDALLKLIAERLQETVENSGNLARVGADTFAVGLMNIRDDAVFARNLEEKIYRVLGRPFTLEGQELRLSFKCGIALFPGDGPDAETLLKNADAARRKAKDSGDRYLFYAPQMNARVAEILSLENKLRIAVAEEQFVLHYQPKLSLDTGRITGLEALIRWNSPELGLVPPYQFIPILEETGMIIEVGSWVLQQAARDQRRWRQQGLEPPRVAVNVSSLQLRERGFIDEVLEVIAEGKDSDPVAIDLEITESVIMHDIERYIVELKKLRAHGVGVEIDDFGTGYSSLSYIAKLPVTALKIDRAFINDMGDGDEGISIVSTIISLAHSLNLAVVAEGVETAAQRDLLKTLKCDTLQGYYFSKPVAAAAIAAMPGIRLGAR